MSKSRRVAQEMAARCPVLQVRKAARFLGRLFDQELEPFGLQSSQLPVLVGAALFGESGAPISRLAQALLMDRTTLTRNIRPLERAGLVRIARSARDARTKTVLITRAGESALESVHPAWERAVRRIEAAVGVEPLAQLHARIDALIALPLQGATATDQP